MIFINKKVEIGICDRPDIPTAAAPALQFLQAEMQKQE